jgi:hypothetical protein
MRDQIQWKMLLFYEGFEMGPYIWKWNMPFMEYNGSVKQKYCVSTFGPF